MTKEDISNVVRDLESELKACKAERELINEKKKYIRKQIEKYTAKCKQDRSEYLMKFLSLYNSSSDHLLFAEFSLDTRIMQLLPILNALLKEQR